jgi:hypothetical protein
MNMSILDTIKIKFKLRNIDENPLAIVTLNINDEVEVRFCPIFWKQSKTGLFFTMPSLKGFRNQNCFVVLDSEKYKFLQERVINEFLVQAEEFYHPNEYKLIVAALNIEIKKIEGTVDSDVEF